MMPMMSAAMIFSLRVCWIFIRMVCEEAALLATLATWLNTPQRKFPPLTDHGFLKFLLAAEIVCLPGFYFQVDSRKDLLQLLIRGFADPLVELSVHSGN